MQQKEPLLCPITSFLKTVQKSNFCNKNNKSFFFFYFFLNLLDSLDGDFGLPGPPRGLRVGEHVLVDVEGGQPERDVVLELRREPLLDHVVAALDVQVLEGHRVLPEQLVRVLGHERHPEQAAQVVGARPGCDLKNGIVSFWA